MRNWVCFDFTSVGSCHVVMNEQLPPDVSGCIYTYFLTGSASYQVS